MFNMPHRRRPHMKAALGFAGLCTWLLAGTLTHCATGVPGADDAGTSFGGSSGGGSSGGSGGDDSTVPFSSSGASGGSSGAGSSGGSSGASSGGSSGGSSSGTASSSGNPVSDSGCPADNTTQTTFVNLAAPLLSALTMTENDPIPSDGGGPTSPQTPAGWNYYNISGAMCRDGTPAGIFVHYGTANKLFIYLEGGGACSSATFCSHNPAEVDNAFSGGAQSQGQTIGGSLGNVAGATMLPYVPTAASGLTPAYSPGIFDFTNSANPVKDWSGVYVPYCTGDVHFGTNDNVTIPGDGVLPALNNQHFVGYRNMQKFMGHLVPTFPNVTQVLLTGASAGGFGAGLNFGMVQDTFNSNGKTIPVTVIDDSGPPFRTQFLPPCIQKTWRELWGFDAALPSDCKECFNSDGSGLTDVVLYWHHKYKNARVGLISTMQDEVMRLFFASGDNMCASNNATALSLSPYPADQYTMGLNDLVTTYQCTGALATYYIGGMNSNFPNPTYHQHIFRSEFYTVDTNSGSVTMAQWMSNVLNGDLQIVGP
jgi:hypothetical protein